MKTAYVLLVLLTPAVLGCAGDSKSDPRTAAGARQREVEVTREPEDTADGGFVLEVSKAVDSKPSKSLRVLYTWGGKPPREAWVSDAGGSWRVQFQDRPAPSELTTLKLEYVVDVTGEELRQAQLAFEEARSVFLTAARKAFGAAARAPSEKQAAFVKALTDELQTLEPVLAKVKDLRTPSGSAADLVLQQLGLTREAGGALVQSKVGYAQLPDFAELQQNVDKWTSGRDHAAAELRKAKVGKCGDTELKPDAGVDQLVAAVGACHKALLVELQAIERYETANQNERAFKVEAFAAAWKAFKAARDSLARSEISSAALLAGDLPGEVELLANLSALSGKYQALVDAASDAQKQALQALSPKAMPSFWATMWAAHQLRVQALADAAFEAFAQRITLRTVTLTQEQEGSLLLARSKERRYWDFATGAVYVTELDDVVLPMMLAYCPAGCLRPGENIVTDPWKVASIDFGTRAAVFDSTIDERQSHQPALLVGASLNPFYFLRASAGMFSFENAQTDRWNQSWYVGATINVIHVAEMLGPLGLDPGKMKVVDDELKK